MTDNLKIKFPVTARGIAYGDPTIRDTDGEIVCEVWSKDLTPEQDKARVLFITHAINAAGAMVCAAIVATKDSK